LGLFFLKNFQEDEGSNAFRQANFTLSFILGKSTIRFHKMLVLVLVIFYINRRHVNLFCFMFKKNVNMEYKKREVIKKKNHKTVVIVVFCENLRMRFV